MRPAHPNYERRVYKAEPMAKTFNPSRSVPEDGTPHEVRLQRLEWLAHVMDTAIVNIRLGADALIGLVPGIGDLATACVASYVVLEARKMGAPNHLIARMIGNIAIDGLAGSVPLVGDLFDVAFRANVRNVRLLRQHFDKQKRR
jgi:hypothetical protein